MGPSKMTGELLTKSESLSNNDWPDLETVKNITLESKDCYLVGAGFEDRALHGLKKACNESSCFSVGVIRYLPEINQNRINECKSLCKKYSINFTEFEYDREKPAGFGIVLSDFASGFEKVFLDISGMSRLLIVQAIVSLVESDIEFHILYSEAFTYPPLQSEFENKVMSNDGSSVSFISTGIFEIVSTPELSSVAMLGGEIRLISFPSFDPIQLSNLVQEVQPTHNNVIHGKPTSPELFWRKDAITNLNQKTIETLQRPDNHICSTLDYQETLRLILSLYNKHSVFDRFLIAPTGSKMQAVAIGILRGVMHDLQIVYPTPQTFVEPDRYTKGVKQMYKLSGISALVKI